MSSRRRFVAAGFLPISGDADELLPILSGELGDDSSRRPFVADCDSVSSRRPFVAGVALPSMSGEPPFPNAATGCTSGLPIVPAAASSTTFAALRPMLSSRSSATNCKRASALTVELGTMSEMASAIGRPRNMSQTYSLNAGDGNRHRTRHTHAARPYWSALPSDTCAYTPLARKRSAPHTRLTIKVQSNHTLFLRSVLCSVLSAAQAHADPPGCDSCHTVTSPPSLPNQVQLTRPPCCEVATRYRSRPFLQPGGSSLSLPAFPPN